MLTFFKKRIFLFLLIICFNLNAELIFQTDFTKGIPSEMKEFGEVKTADGKTGKGIFCAKSYVSIGGEKNFNLKKGSVAFWFSPSWYGPESLFSQYYKFKARRLLFVSDGKQYINLRFFRSRLLCEISGQIPAERYNKADFYPIYEWCPGEWYFIVLNYDENSVELFINDQKAFSIPRQNQTVGNKPASVTFGAPHKGICDGTFDNISISNEKLTINQIKDLFRKNAGIQIQVELPNRIPFTLYRNEPLKVKLTNYSNQKQKIIFDYKINDFRTPEMKCINKGNITINLLPGKSQFITVFNAKDMKRPYGAFELISTASANGKIIARKTRNFGCGVNPLNVSKIEDSQFGWWIHWRFTWLDPVRANDPRGLGSYKNMGCKWVRIPLNWHKVQPKPEKFDWNKNDVDDVINEARKNNINIMAQLGHPPRWAADAPLDRAKWRWRKNYSIYPPQKKYMKEWSEYVYKTVTRYKDQIKHWGIWNEPYTEFFSVYDHENKRYFKTGGYEQGKRYWELVETASKAIRKADPDAKILINVKASLLEHMIKASNGKVFDCMDIYALHLYRQESPEHGQGVHRANKVIKLIKKHNAVKPIWDTESGRAAAPRETNRPMLPKIVKKNIQSGLKRIFTWMYPVTDEWDQASHVVREHVISFSMGIDKVFYLLCDYTRSSRSWPDGAPTPSGIATLFMVKQLTGAKYVRSLKQSEKNQYAFIFKRIDGTNLLVCWDSKKNSNLILTGISGKEKLFDIYGNHIDMGKRKSPLIVNLSKYPVYIENVANNIKILPSNIRIKKDFDALPVNSEKNAPVNILIDNKHDTLMEGTLSIDVPKGWQVKPRTVNLHLPPVTTKSIPIQLFTPKKASDGICQINVVLETSGKRFSKSFPVKLLNPAFIEYSEHKKWGKPLLINKSHQVVIGLRAEGDIYTPDVYKSKSKWKGLDDLSGKVFFCWDKNNLYMKAVISDNYVTPNTNITTLYEGDCVELFINTKNISNKQGGKFQLLLSPGKEQAGSCHIYSFDSSVKEIKAKYQKNGNEYTITAEIPWQTLGIKPERDMRIRLDVGIDDADINYKNGKTRKCQMMWRGTQDNSRKMDDYGMVILKQEGTE